MSVRIHPADWVTLCILGIVAATLAAAVVAGAHLAGALLLHAALLLGFAGLVLLVAHHPGARWAAYLRAAAVVAVMFTLYGTLGYVAFEAIPWTADSLLTAADRGLFGGQIPSLLLDRPPVTRWAEFLSFFYAAFIPYLYLSIFLGLVGRPPGEREEFVTGFALLYALSFLGYLFLPARGPVVQLAGDFAGPLPGGTFHRLVVESIDRMGGPHGAFPSLHAGASFYAMYFDVRHQNLLRGLIYLPLFLLIVAATLVLRYHYVVDLIAGVLLAVLASHGAAAVLARWRARVRAAGPERAE